MEMSCENCNKHETPECSMACTSDCPTGWKPKEMGVISFRRLNSLTPTLQSCTAKVYEEIGELMQLLGKGQKQSGELCEALNNHSEWVRRTVEEALDGAQSLVTLVFTLLDEPDDIQIALERHEDKLRKKGYLV